MKEKGYRQTEFDGYGYVVPKQDFYGLYVMGKKHKGLKLEVYRWCQTNGIRYVKEWKRIRGFYGLTYHLVGFIFENEGHYMAFKLRWT